MGTEKFPKQPSNEGEALKEAWRDVEKKEEARRQKLIHNARSFDELYEALENIGRIETSQGERTDAFFIDQIDRFREGKINILYITNTAGLREKVLSLSGEESKTAEEKSEKNEMLSDPEKERLVEASASFDKLYEAIRKIGSLQGKTTKHVFKPEELIEIIEGVRSKTHTADYVPRTFNLRKKVIEFLKSGEKQNSTQ